MRSSAFIHPSAEAAATAPGFPGIGHLAVRLLGAIRRWHMLRRAMADIDELDEATLRDLGLTRWELREAARR